MTIISSLKKNIKKNAFNPTIPFGLISPFYITRKILFNSIRSYSSLLEGRLLDVGCGSKPYQALFKTENYTGIDIENPSHSHQNEDVDAFYNGINIPFENQSFDSCFSSEVFEHVFNLDQTLQEINRVLKPNGHILITTPFIWDEHEAPYDFCRYTSFGLRDIFERNGFKVIEQKKEGSFIQLIAQLTLIFLNRKLAESKHFRHIFFVLICPILNILSHASPKASAEPTLYLANIVVAVKI